MRKLISAFTVVAIVGSAFAFRPLGDGSVYCNSACSTASKIDFKIDETGLSTITDPCLNGAGGEYIVTYENCTRRCIEITCVRYVSTHA